ncbi:MAG: LysM peptidoglycan-binding domain-containing protein [Candidatus Gastranaerophilaceae bacterium]
MKNSTLNRSMLSGENMALLAELKAQNEEEESLDKKNSAVNKTEKQDELDILWQNFKFSQREEKSPGIYIFAGFIAGALSMFLMTAMLSITTFSVKDTNAVQERKIVKKAHGSFLAGEINQPAPIKIADEEISGVAENIQPAVVNDKYTVKAGDSLEAISVKFYGKTSPENTEKLQKANNLASPHAIYAGQELVIPLS